MTCVAYHTNRKECLDYSVVNANKDNMRTWIQALESGNYTQGHQYLLADGKYCCLGVACEVAKLNGLDVKTQKPNLNSLEDVSAVVSFNEDFYGLPQVVSLWLGVCNSTLCVYNPASPEEHEIKRVIKACECDPESSDPCIISVDVLNDVYGYTFEQIADALRVTYGL